VTPFSATSLERGLVGVLVSAARVLQAASANGLSPEKDAYRIDAARPFMDSLIEALVNRARQASDDDSADYTRRRLANRLDVWEARHRETLAQQLTLAYERFADTTKFAALIRSAESAPSRDLQIGGPPFVVANSMREVQPEINLLVSPDPARLYFNPANQPGWQPQPATGGDE